MPRIYLASASPRRHEILEQMGIAHDILGVPAPEGEDEPRHANETAHDYVTRTAREKALRANQWVKTARLPERPILAADTCVSLSDDIFGKPRSVDEAKAMLRHLAGKTHRVQTAVVLINKDQLHECLSTTEVTFADLADHEINSYALSNDPWGKAGGYGIQGSAASFISNINGSYSGVMGLPIYETTVLLKAIQLTGGQT